MAVLLPHTDDGSRLPHHHDQQIDPHGLDAASAAKLVTACTTPGDLVADLTASPAIATAVHALERHLHTPRSAASPEGLAQLLIDQLPAEEALGLLSITEWIRARRSALAPGAHLIITVDPGRFQTKTQPQGTDEGFVDWPTEVITAARVAGLTYIQHLVTIRRPAHEAPEPTTAQRSTSRLARTHSDLLVFRAPHAGTTGRGA